MPRWMLRIVALALTPCLLADPALAIALHKSAETPLNSVAFAEQALTAFLQEVRIPFFSNRQQRQAEGKVSRMSRRGFFERAAGASVAAATLAVAQETVPSFRSAMPPQALTLSASNPPPARGKSVPYNIIQEPFQAGHQGGPGTSVGRNLFGQFTSVRFSAKPSTDIFPEGQIAIFEKQGSRTWATPLGRHPDPTHQKDKRLSAWPWRRADAMATGATFRGLFPFAQWEYPIQSPGRTAVTVRQFSPFIPKSLNALGMPVMITEVEVENKSGSDSEVAVLMSLPNLAGWSMKYADPVFQLVPTNDGQAHQGVDQGVVMGASKTPDLNFAGQIAIIAERQPDTLITHQSSFDAGGDGSDVWEPFSMRGELNPAVISKGNEQAGAVAVKVTLKAGERRVIRFAAAFDFPRDVRNGVIFAKNYVRRYGLGGNHAEPMALEALSMRASWEQQIRAWHASILNDAALPDALKTMLINETYYFTAGSALYTTAGDYYALEGLDPRLMETLDVRFYNPEMARLFPELERRMILRFANAVPTEDKRIVRYMNPGASVDPITGRDNLADYGMDPELNRQLREKPGDFDINGKAPGYRKVAGAVEHHENERVEGPVTDAAGNPIADRINRYLQNHNLWKDLSPKLVLMAWRYYAMNGKTDKEFLRAVWPNLVKTVAYHQRFDLDKDGLPDHMGIPDWTYDAWTVKGPTTYTGLLTVEALEAMLAIGREIGIPAGRLASYQKWRDAGKASLQAKLWNGTYFNVAQGNTDIMSDALIGATYAKLYGLPCAISDDQIRGHLRKVHDNNLKKFAGGHVGIVNSMRADGTTHGTSATGIQEGEVWIGAQRGVIALEYLVGMTEQANETLEIDFNSTWRDAYAGRTPEAITAERNNRFATYLRSGAIGMIYQALKLRATALRPARKEIPKRIQIKKGERGISFAAFTAWALTLLGISVAFFVVYVKPLTLAVPSVLADTTPSPAVVWVIGIAAGIAGIVLAAAKVGSHRRLPVYSLGGPPVSIDPTHRIPTAQLQDRLRELTAFSKVEVVLWKPLERGWQKLRVTIESKHPKSNFDDVWRRIEAFVAGSSEVSITGNHDIVLHYRPVVTKRPNGFVFSEFIPVAMVTGIAGIAASNSVLGIPQMLATVMFVIAVVVFHRPLKRKIDQWSRNDSIRRGWLYLQKEYSNRPEFLSRREAILRLLQADAEDVPARLAEAVGQTPGQLDLKDLRIALAAVRAGTEMNVGEKTLEGLLHYLAQRYRGEPWDPELTDEQEWLRNIRGLSDDKIRRLAARADAIYQETELGTPMRWTLWSERVDQLAKTLLKLFSEDREFIGRSPYKEGASWIGGNQSFIEFSVVPHLTGRRLSVGRTLLPGRHIRPSMPDDYLSSEVIFGPQSIELRGWKPLEEGVRQLGRFSIDAHDNIRIVRVPVTPMSVSRDFASAPLRGAGVKEGRLFLLVTPEAAEFLMVHEQQLAEKLPFDYVVTPSELVSWRYLQPEPTRPAIPKTAAPPRFWTKPAGSNIWFFIGLVLHSLLSTSSSSRLTQRSA